jgi:hypothetical protein
MKRSQKASNCDKLGSFSFALSECSKHVEKRCLRNCSEILWAHNQKLLLDARISSSNDETDAAFKGLIFTKLNEHTFQRTSDHVNLKFTATFQPLEEHGKEQKILRRIISTQLLF